jgi:hypothetical protein
VQQCGACNTHIVLKLDATELAASVRKLASFVTWLPKHASLVRTLTVEILHSSSTPHIEASQQMLSLLQPALQLAAVRPLAMAAAGQHASVMPAAGGATAGAAAESAAAVAARSAAGLSLLPLRQQQQQQVSPGLRLERFTSTAPGAAALLAVLPAHSLTH